MKKKQLINGLILGTLALTACNSDDTSSAPTPSVSSTETKSNQIILDVSHNGISTVIPNSLGDIYNSKNFNRYTKVTAPNGGSIHIVAQDKITNEQIIRCRNILQHYLTNYTGSQYGADKSAVANKMADNNAILVLLNGQDDGTNPLSEQVTGQPLYQNEIQVEGHDWYMNQNYAHRDAAFEEILHFVHDYGIGIDGNDDFIGALPDYQKEIRIAQQNASSKKLWGHGTENQSWLKELAQENSLTQEYLASVIDSYYGLWGAWQEGKGSMWDIYIAKMRNDEKIKDAKGYNLISKFFHPYLTYNAQISASLNGNFSLRFNPAKPYTHHSQYLKDVTLLGKNDNNVTVNELDNHITGNAGTNTVIFSGKSDEYTISKKKDKILVKDGKAERDGSNTLSNIEKLQFTDKTIAL